MNSYETIKRFLSEMLAWETNYWRFIRSQEYKTGGQEFRSISTNKNREILSDIFVRCLTSDAMSTIGQANLATMAVGNPPNYEQTLEDFKEKGDAAEVTTAQANAGGFSRFCQYKLSRENGVWKIKAVFRSFDKAEWTKARSI